VIVVASVIWPPPTMPREEAADLQAAGDALRAYFQDLSTRMVKLTPAGERDR
jgi:hypothetical protein